MNLQLIDLGHEVDYIDIDPNKVPYSFQIKLGDKTFRFTFRFNSAGGFYTTDLHTVEGEVLAYGDPVRYGRPLFGNVEDERFPLPVIIPQCLEGDGADAATRENFGRAVRLYLHAREG